LWEQSGFCTGRKTAICCIVMLLKSISFINLIILLCRYAIIRITLINYEHSLLMQYVHFVIYINMYKWVYVHVYKCAYVLFIYLITLPLLKLQILAGFPQQHNANYCGPNV
jgi:hypothetical protein